MDRATKERLAKERRRAEASKILSLAPTLQLILDEYRAAFSVGLREREKAEWHFRIFAAFQAALPDYKWTDKDGRPVKARDHDVVAALLDTNVPEINYPRTIAKAEDAARFLRKSGLEEAEVNAILARTRDVLWGLTDKGIPVSSVNKLQSSAVKDAEAGICTFEEAVNRRAVEALAAIGGRKGARGSRGVWSQKATTHVVVSVESLPPTLQAAIDRHIAESLVHMDEIEREHERRMAQDGFGTVMAAALAKARRHGGEPEHVPADKDTFKDAIGAWFMRALAHLPLTEQHTLAADAVLGVMKQWEAVAVRGDAARKRAKARAQPIVRSILDRLGVSTIVAAEKMLRATIAETHPDRGGDAERFMQARKDLLIVQEFKRLSKKG